MPDEHYEPAFVIDPELLKEDVPPGSRSNDRNIMAVVALVLAAAAVLVAVLVVVLILPSQQADTVKTAVAAAFETMTLSAEGNGSSPMPMDGTGATETEGQPSIIDGGRVTDNSAIDPTNTPSPTFTPTVTPAPTETPTPTPEPEQVELTIQVISAESDNQLYIGRDDPYTLFIEGGRVGDAVTIIADHGRIGHADTANTERCTTEAGEELSLDWPAGRSPLQIWYCPPDNAEAGSVNFTVSLRGENRVGTGSNSLSLVEQRIAVVVEQIETAYEDQTEPLCEGFSPEPLDEQAEGAGAAADAPALPDTEYIPMTVLLAAGQTTFLNDLRIESSDLAFELWYAVFNLAEDSTLADCVSGLTNAANADPIDLNAGQMVVLRMYMQPKETIPYAAQVLPLLTFNATSPVSVNDSGEDTYQVLPIVLIDQSIDLFSNADLNLPADGRIDVAYQEVKNYVVHTSQTLTDASPSYNNGLWIQVADGHWLAVGPRPSGFTVLGDLSILDDVEPLSEPTEQSAEPATAAPATNVQSAQPPVESQPMDGPDATQGNATSGTRDDETNPGGDGQ